MLLQKYVSSKVVLHQ